ncbi:MAG: DUF4175 family protein [Archangiaceae bacterium]|nr:DUF4175 family protein [Archangiaceae bacterium]
MLEPVANPPSPHPPAPKSEPPSHTERLLDRVRAGQRRALWTQGALLAAAATLPLLLLGALLTTRFLWGGRLLLLGALPAGAMVALYCGLWLWRERAGSKLRTAVLVSKAMPELGLDVLAAVELSRALGHRDDFSPELARAFLKQLDQRTARADPLAAVDRTQVRRAGLVLGIALVLCAALGFWQRHRARAGLELAFSGVPKAALIREPITGDVELTYRYPAYTGLMSRTVAGTNGEVSAPAGTEVLLKTRADRDIEGAALDVDGKQVPLTLKGRRDLEGAFIIERTGHYHFLFLDGRAIEAEGPDVAVRAEADAPPAVHLSAPPDELEVDNDKQSVTLKYEATDDYGLSELELTYRVPGQAEVTVPLQHDDGRSTRGEYAWNIASLHLVPGQRVQYNLRATDNDEVSGKKSGTSRTQTLKLYSASEHRREALKRAEALWERLLLHLADRMESNDRLADKTPEMAAGHSATDAQGTQLALDANALAGELSKERDAPTELINALANTGTQLQRDVGQTTLARQLFLRMAKASQPKSFGMRLSNAVSTEIKTTEQAVLYLESLLDRVKMKDLKELAEQLKKDRRELAELLEKVKNSNDDADKQKLLEQISALRERMEQLSQRMAELAGGIRDEFMNSDALKEMAQDSTPNQLDEIEKLVREGKLEEAMSKLQEMSMQMDDMLNELDQAAEAADENADPELARKFESFQKDLDQVTRDQEQLAEKTRQMRDKSRAAMKEQISRRGNEVKQKVLEQAAQLKASLQSLDADSMSSRAEKPREASLKDLSHLESALKADDFDLAADLARDLEAQTQELAEQGDSQRRQDEMFGNPPEIRKKSREQAEHLKGDHQKAENITRQLDSLFPQPQQMSEGDRQQLESQEQAQRSLQKRAQQLQQQMDDIQQRAPVFDPETEGQLERAQSGMDQASQRLRGREPGRGFSEQQGAIEALHGLQQQMQQQKGSGKRMPMPMSRNRPGGMKHDKVEIPDEDPSRAPRELRKDVMDAMKQGAPERYKDQVKRYYEELVK